MYSHIETQVSANNFPMPNKYIAITFKRHKEKPNVWPNRSFG